MYRFAFTYVRTYMCICAGGSCVHVCVYVCMMEYYKVLSRKQFVSVSDAFFLFFFIMTN